MQFESKPVNETFQHESNSDATPLQELRRLKFAKDSIKDMAAAALGQRDLTAAKLNETARQLTRYVESGAKSKRILEKRCEKLESEKDELLGDHHRYAEKSGTSLENEEMENYLNFRLDAAEDVLNTAYEI